MAQHGDTVLADREAALAAWRALPAQSRRRAWQAAAKPEPIDDPQLAAVVARYATAMRSQVPAGLLVVSLALLFAWLAVALYWITHGRTGFGVVLAAIGVIAAGLSIGALQVRQANYDRLYACAVTGPAAAGAARPRARARLRGGKLARLPEGEQAEQGDRADQDADLDGGPVGPGSVGDAGTDQPAGDQAAEVAGDGDAGHGQREDQVDHDDRQDRRGTEP